MLNLDLHRPSRGVSGWRVAIITLAALAIGCSAILSLDQFRACEGSECDASVDGGGDASTDASDGGPLTPVAIFGSTNLVLWLDADDATTIQLAGNAVAGWSDRSTFANDAHTYYASDASAITVAQAAVNGHAAMKLSGNFSSTGIFDVPDTLPLEFGKADFIITMVVAYTNTPGPDEYGGRGGLWEKANAAVYPYWGPIMTANAYSAPQPDGGVGPPDSIIFGGVKTFVDGPSSGAWSAKNGWNDGAFHVFTLRKDTANSVVYIRTDGLETVSQPIDASVNLSGIGSDVMIGGYIVNGTCCFSPLRGYIAEVIAARNTAGSKSERDQLGIYLNTKYGLTF